MLNIDEYLEQTSAKYTTRTQEIQATIDIIDKIGKDYKHVLVCYCNSLKKAYICTVDIYGAANDPSVDRGEFLELAMRLAESCDWNIEIPVIYCGLDGFVNAGNMSKQGAKQILSYFEGGQKGATKNDSQKLDEFLESNSLTLETSQEEFDAISNLIQGIDENNRVILLIRRSGDTMYVSQLDIYADTVHSTKETQFINRVFTDMANNCKWNDEIPVVLLVDQEDPKYNNVPKQEAMKILHQSWKAVNGK